MIDPTRVVYRDATIADARALSQIARATFLATFAHLYPIADRNIFLATTYAPDIQAAEIADPATRHRLAFCDEALVGFAKLGALKLPIAAPRPALELHRLYLVEEAKGAGIADALMDWAENSARALGAADLYLGVYQGNARAQRFYARRGYTIVGAYEFAVGETRDPEFILTRALDAPAAPLSWAREESGR